VASSISAAPQPANHAETRANTPNIDGNIDGNIDENFDLGRRASTTAGRKSFIGEFR
jgi:hypothetical protein